MDSKADAPEHRTAGGPAAASATVEADPPPRPAAEVRPEWTEWPAAPAGDDSDRGAPTERIPMPPVPSFDPAADPDRLTQGDESRPTGPARHLRPGGAPSWVMVGFAALVVAAIAGFAFLRPGDKAPPDNLLPSTAPAPSGSVDILLPDSGGLPPGATAGAPGANAGTPSVRATSGPAPVRQSAPAPAPRRSQAPAGPAAVVPAAGNTYSLVNASSGDTLSVGGARSWSLRDAGGDDVSLVGNGQCLDLPLLGRSQDGARLNPFLCTSSSSQQWSLDPVGDGTYRLRNARSELCLADNGSSAVQTDCASGATVHWRFR